MRSHRRSSTVFVAVTTLLVGGLSLRAGAALMVPAYNSFPSATAKIYLDFDGDNTATYGDYHPGVTPAYSIDADADNFSDAELENIHRIWMGVSEKYSPFRINVTTVDPMRESNAITRIVIGGSGLWAPVGSGGIGITGSVPHPHPHF